MVIGIGGISNAGKSHLARQIKNYFHKKKVCILCQDDYVFPKEKIPLIRDHIDWECPESIDFNRFHNVVLEKIELFDIVIIEGIFAFNFEATSKIMDKKLFLTLDQIFFFMRKNKDLRWGKEPDWYMEHIWDSHTRYCKENIPIDSLIIKAGKEVNMLNIIEFIQTDSVK